jgi:sulfur-oxidizing protein SoxZ
MAEAMKIRADLIGNMAKVKCLINHPMETGLRKDKNGQVVPAHYITQVSATLNGVAVMDGQVGSGISSNPFLMFWIQRTKPGDKIMVSWVDNTGGKNSAETTIG